MNPLELLSPDSVRAQVQHRADELLAVVDEKRKSLNKAPVGRIKMIRHGRGVHCYHVTDAKKTSGEYIPVSNKSLIKALAQKEYDSAVLKELQKELSLIDGFLTKYRPEALMELFRKKSECRRRVIDPVQLSNEDYAARWLSEVYEGKDFDVEAPEHLTVNGERVRSKSEVIIADTLARHGVPYRYERPLLLNCGTSAAKRIAVYPDFTCLNLRTRKEFLWEHLGRMDDPEYAKKTIAKLRSYSKNGFVLGQNLIVTMECEGNPLNRSEVEKLLKLFLL